MKHKQTFLAIAGAAGFMVAAGCDRNDPPPSPKPAAESCCASGFHEAAKAPITQSPLDSYAIVLQNGEKARFDTLIDHENRMIDAAYLNQHFAGKKIAIYFGFPDCTWFCPPSTKAIMGALEALKGSGIVPVFVASRTDPKTGQAYTPERMNEWLHSFGGDDLGGIAITGSPDILARLYDQLNVIAPNGDHLPYVAFIDESGKFLGGAQAVTAGQERGRKVLYPAPQILIPAMTEKFKLPATAADPGPVPGPH